MQVLSSVKSVLNIWTFVTGCSTVCMLGVVCTFFVPELFVRSLCQSCLYVLLQYGSFFMFFGILKFLKKNVIRNMEVVCIFFHMEIV